MAAPVTDPITFSASTSVPLSTPGKIFLRLRVAFVP